MSQKALRRKNREKARRRRARLKTLNLCVHCGSKVGSRRHALCVKSRSATQKTYWLGSKHKAAKERYRATPRGRAMQLYDNAKYRAVVSGITFSLTIERVIEALTAGVCEITGIRFVYGKGRLHMWSPSIDRTSNADGYTDENTKIVVFAYNAAKCQGSHADVMKLALALVATARRRRRSTGK